MEIKTDIPVVDDPHNITEGWIHLESRKRLFKLFLPFSRERLSVTVYVDVVDRVIKALWPSYVGRMGCEFEARTQCKKKGFKTIEVISKCMFMQGSFCKSGTSIFALCVP